MTPKDKLGELLERLPEELMREGEGFIPDTSDGVASAGGGMVDERSISEIDHNEHQGHKPAAGS